ncbi:hypothetical protein [Salmonirosea aquatica]|uniref:Uncharacterized protein n=1 Tax=Salmonirosea aquatica TaxID=2654236 RepID=A0A7C9FQV3_9BACT|nr:hypothetical protein [Cytophagaceae bacterium SJW1-29]
MLLFDLVFKSGEFYGDEGSFIQDFIIAVVGAGIGAYVTFRVFRETLKADREKENRARAEEKEKEARQRGEEKEKELKAKNDLENERLIYLHYLVRSSIWFTEDYINNLNQFNRDFEKNRSKIPSLLKTPPNNLERVTNSIDRELHFHAYKNHIPGHGILRFYSSLDYIEGVRLVIDRSIRKANKLEIKNKDEFRDNIEKLKLLNIKYLEESELQEFSFDDVFDMVEQIMSDLTNILKANNSDHQAIINKVATPIIDLYLNVEKKGLSNNIREMFNVACKLKKTNILLESVSNKIAINLKQYSEDLTIQLINLKNEFQALDNYCNRKFPDQS